MTIIQSIMLHYIINVRKVCLDHFREGLKTLNVLQSIESFPDVWEEMFVHSDSAITSEKFKYLFKQPRSMTENQLTIWQYLQQFLDSCSSSGNIHYVYNAIEQFSFHIKKIQAKTENAVNCQKCEW